MWRDILSTVGVFSTVGDIISSMGDILSRLGDVQYPGGTQIIKGDIPHGTHDISQIYHDIPHGTEHTLYRVVFSFKPCN